MPLNIEIKARIRDPDKIRRLLKDHQAEFAGTDLQKDTYFIVSHGRLKLREGNIEHNLIWYQRADEQGPKQSSFQLINTREIPQVREMLTCALGIKVTVAKRREIYYVGNIKFHIDEVPGLGAFVEIEAGNLNNPGLDRSILEEQCALYIRLMDIDVADLLDRSYSDMIMELAENNGSHPIE